MADELPPAGWHPDPDGSPRQRYWDGQTWTDHYAPMAEPVPPQSGVSPTEIAESAKQYKADHGSPSMGQTLDRIDPFKLENLKKFWEWSKVHPILGLLVVALVGTSVIIGVFFPEKFDTPTPEVKHPINAVDKDGRRYMSGTWTVHIDPDRAIKLTLDGWFEVTQDKTEAKAGETDINVETSGSITAKNISDGRKVRGIDTGLELFAPVKSCPDWDPQPTGSYCSRDLVSFDIPDLDVGESDTFGISDEQRVRSVRERDAKKVIDGMLGKSGVVVSADRVWVNEYLEKLNPTCTFKDTTWITYYTENRRVTACSTSKR